MSATAILEAKPKAATTSKSKLYEELKIKADLAIDGVDIHPTASEALKNISHQEQVHSGFEMDLETHVGREHPSGFHLPLGLKTAFKWSRKSRYSITHEGGQFLLTRKGRQLFPIRFFEQPKYYKLKSEEGIPLKNIATFTHDSNLSVFYSNECNYKEKGEDCLFCNVNATKDTYGEHEGIKWKSPRQAAEAVKAAYDEGIADHVTITGGIISERREIEYYQDVAEAIQQRTGLTDFNGTAVIAAPLDLNNINRLKEAGYRTVALNIEVWDKNVYKVMCPGKARNSGGWDHWLKAIEYAVGVFGFGRVRSNIVAGLEPKPSTLAGVAYFSERGIVCLPGAWCPNPGSALEGHRTPEPAWHLDLSEKAVRLQKQAGITYAQVHDASNNDLGLARDIWKIEEGYLQAPE
ncbi:MAG TPA: radical SAM protein [Verrucomicrobiae bacterium]